MVQGKARWYRLPRTAQKLIFAAIDDLTASTPRYGGGAILMNVETGTVEHVSYALRKSGRETEAF